MLVNDSHDLSGDPSSLMGLSEDQRARLTDLMDRYLGALETGAPLDRERLYEENPDLAEALSTYLDRLDELHEVAAGFVHARESAASGNGSWIDHEPSSQSLEATGDAAPLGEATPEQKRIGDFRILREIGRGGMGVVYEAIQLSLSRRVALKILPFAAVLDSKQIARFRNEAQAAAQLFHPSIVPVYAVGVERGVHYYAMKYIDGQPLDQAIAQLRASSPELLTHRVSKSSPGTGTNDRALNDTVAFPDAPTQRSAPHAPPISASSLPTGRAISGTRREQIRTAIRLGIQAAEALHAAHEYGIIHRDIKPSNLMIDAEGQLWITDFGLARLPTETSLTRTGDVVGTLRYMSPEQASGQSALVDARCDIYSLGVTLYELLTLEPAHRGDDPQALLRRIGQESPESPRRRCPDIPVDLDTVITKAISHLPAERYSTAREMADDLRRVLEGKPTLAKPPTLFDRVNKWTRRHTRLVLSVAAASLLLAVGLSAATVVVIRAKSQADTSFTRAEKNFRTAHVTVDRFGARLAERLAGIPGAAGVRRELLVETLAYYQQFVAEAEHDPTLRADLALTYSKIGAMIEETGTLADAIAAHEKSVELFAKLASGPAQDAKAGDVGEFTRRLALACNNLATALMRAGRLDEAAAQFATAIDIQERLLVSNPQGEQPRADLALTLANLGQLQRDRPAAANADSESTPTKVAERTLRRAIAFQKDLVAEFPAKIEHLRNLAASYNNLSGLFVDRTPRLAQEYFESALKLQQQLFDLDPQNAVVRSDLAVTYNNLAAIESRLGRLDAAATAYGRSIELRQDLVRAAPTQRIYRRDLALALNNLGSVESQQRKPALAQKSFDRALKLHETLVAGHENDAELRGSLGGIYNNLGIALEELRQPEKAAEAYGRAIEHQRAALSAAPDVERYRAFLSKHLFNFGRVLRQLGRYDDAIQTALARKALWPKQADRLYSIAEELALAYDAMRHASTKVNASNDQPADAVTASAVFSPTSVDRCETLVIDTVRQTLALDPAYAAKIEQSEAFATLRQQANFRGRIAQQ